MKCRGVLYLGGSTDEYNDWRFQVNAECDDTGARDCGFYEHLSQYDGDESWFINSDEFAEIQARHLAHAGGVA